MARSKWGSKEIRGDSQEDDCHRPNRWPGLDERPFIFSASLPFHPRWFHERSIVRTPLGGKMRNLLPTFSSFNDSTETHVDAERNNGARRTYNKTYVDMHRHTRPHMLVPGQFVLCEQQQDCKFTPFYNQNPCTIATAHGSRITASRNGKFIT